MSTLLPEEMNGGPPEAPQQETLTFDDLATALGNGMRSAAESGAGSNDPDAALKFAQAAFAYAQAMEKLLPPKADPASQTKAEADMTKAGAQMAHDEAKHEMQLEHDRALAERQAVGRTGNNGGSNG